MDRNAWSGSWFVSGLLRGTIWTGYGDGPRIPSFAD